MAQSPNLNSADLLSAMTTAGRGFLAGEWDAVQNYLVPQLERIAAQCVAIDQALSDETISQAQAKSFMDDQVANAMTTLTGMTVITAAKAEAALNAILDAVKTAINAAVKFPILP